MICTAVFRVSRGADALVRGESQRLPSFECDAVGRCQHNVACHNDPGTHPYRGESRPNFENCARCDGRGSRFPGRGIRLRHIMIHSVRLTPIRERKLKEYQRSAERIDATDHLCRPLIFRLTSC